MRREIVVGIFTLTVGIFLFCSSVSADDEEHRIEERDAEIAEELQIENELKRVKRIQDDFDEDALERVKRVKRSSQRHVPNTHGQNFKELKKKRHGNFNRHHRNQAAHNGNRPQLAVPKSPRLLSGRHQHHRGHKLPVPEHRRRQNNH